MMHVHGFHNRGENKEIAHRIWSRLLPGYPCHFRDGFQQLAPMRFAWLPATLAQYQSLAGSWREPVVLVGRGEGAAVALNLAWHFRDHPRVHIRAVIAVEPIECYLPEGGQSQTPVTLLVANLGSRIVQTWRERFPRGRTVAWTPDQPWPMPLNKLAHE